MTGREDLARAIHATHFNGLGQPTCGFPPLPGLCMKAGADADAALTHIAAVLHDDATVEAMAQARRDHQYAGQWTWDRSAKVYLHECRCGEKANDLRAHEAEATIAVLAERLGVPHVDR